MTDFKKHFLPNTHTSLAGGRCSIPTTIIIASIFLFNSIVYAIDLSTEACLRINSQFDKINNTKDINRVKKTLEVLAEGEALPDNIIIREKLLEDLKKTYDYSSRWRKILEKISKNPNIGTLKGYRHTRLDPTSDIYILGINRSDSILYAVFPDNKIVILDLFKMKQLHDKVKNAHWVKRMNKILKEHHKRSIRPSREHDVPDVLDPTELMYNFVNTNKDKGISFITTKNDKRPYILMNIGIEKVKEFIISKGLIIEPIKDQLFDIIENGNKVGRFGLTQDGSVAFSPNRLNNIQDSEFIVSLVKSLKDTNINKEEDISRVDTAIEKIQEKYKRSSNLKRSDYRIATSEDIPKMAKFLKLCDKDFVPPLSERDWFKGFEENLKEFIEKGKVIVAFKPGTDEVACLHITSIESDVRGPYGFLYITALHPDYRGTRLGMEFFMLPPMMRKEIFPGLTRFKTVTWGGSPTERMFPRLGFKLTEVIKGKRGLDKEGNLIDELWFEMDLSPKEPGTPSTDIEKTLIETIEFSRGDIDTRTLSKKQTIFTDEKFNSLNYLAPSAGNMEKEITDRLDIDENKKSYIAFTIYDLLSNSLRYQNSEEPIDVKIDLLDDDGKDVLKITIKQNSSSLSARERLLNNKKGFALKENDPEYFTSDVYRRLDHEFTRAGGGFYHIGKLMEQTDVDLKYEIDKQNSHAIKTVCYIALDDLKGKNKYMASGTRNPTLTAKVDDIRPRQEPEQALENGYTIDKAIGRNKINGILKEWFKGDEEKNFKLKTWKSKIDEHPEGFILSLRSDDGELAGISFIYKRVNHAGALIDKGKSYYMNSLLEISDKHKKDGLGRSLVIEAIKESLNDPDTEDLVLVLEPTAGSDGFWDKLGALPIYAKGKENGLPEYRLFYRKQAIQLTEEKKNISSDMSEVDKENEALIKSIIEIDPANTRWGGSEMLIKMIKGGYKKLISIREPSSRDLIGYVQYAEHGQNRVFIDRIYIKPGPEYRRKGISRSIIKDFKDRFDQISCRPNPDDTSITQGFLEMFKEESFTEDENNPGEYMWSKGREAPEALNQTPINIGTLQKIPIFFLDEEIKDDPEGFKKALGKIDNSNQVIVLVEDDNARNDFIEFTRNNNIDIDKKENFYIETFEDAKIKKNRVKYYLTPILGIEDIKTLHCIPITEDMLKRYPELGDAA